MTHTAIDITPVPQPGLVLLSTIFVRKIVVLLTRFAGFLPLSADRKIDLAPSLSSNITCAPGQWVP